MNATSCLDFKSGQPGTVRTFWLRIRRLVSRDDGLIVRRRVTVNRSSIWFESSTAPRVIHYANTGSLNWEPFLSTTYVERGKSIFTLGTPFRPFSKPKCEHKRPRPDGMERARYYQSLLDSGEVRSRAELARLLGVSRARVTQVLNRLG